jgi:MFS family permease
LLGIVTAALFLPAIVCSFVGDWLCTVFGRKITVYIGSVLIIAGGVWNALATDLGQFAGGTYLPCPV